MISKHKTFLLNMFESFDNFPTYVLQLPHMTGQVRRRRVQATMMDPTELLLLQISRLGDNRHLMMCLGMGMGIGRIYQMSSVFRG